MAIAQQFTGLEMDKLIGGPLSAAADASIQLANSTADFINRVGFDANGSVRTVPFMYQRKSVNEDGSSNLDEMKVDVPMLAIVPIPNLQVDEVNILFDMEVKQSEKSETSIDLGATISGSLNLGIAKVSVTGNVSAHIANTRSSDNSAKYHVDVRATNHGIPEGLARVLDMMAVNISPSLVGTTLKDGNGQDLSENARLKAEKLKALNQEISQIEKQLSAAKNGVDSCIQQMKKLATKQLSVYQLKINNKVKSLDKNAGEEQVKLDNLSEKIMNSWINFQNEVADGINLIAMQTTEEPQEQKKEVSSMFALLALNEELMEAKNFDDEELNYSKLANCQYEAVKMQKLFMDIEKELLTKNTDYNKTLAQPAGTKSPIKAE